MKTKLLSIGTFSLAFFAASLSLAQERERPSREKMEQMRAQAKKIVAACTSDLSGFKAPNFPDDASTKMKDRITRFKQLKFLLDKSPLQAACQTAVNSLSDDAKEHIRNMPDHPRGKWGRRTDAQNDTKNEEE